MVSKCPTNTEYRLILRPSTNSKHTLRPFEGSCCTVTQTFLGQSRWVLTKYLYESNSESLACNTMPDHSLLPSSHHMIRYFFFLISVSFK